MRPIGLISVLFGCLLVPAALARAEEPVDYARQIKPLLKSHCYACHASLKQEGNLRLDTAALALKGGDSGPALVAGKPDASPLIERVTSGDASVRMPQEGTLLTASEIELIRRWIDAGANAPRNEEQEPDPRSHWAFRRPQRPPLPGGNLSGTRTVDRFLAENLAEKGLSAVGPAPKEIQLRRLFLDLIGIPPTREELHAFLADQRPDAYERAVDRLLASPQYGERWARHWMDVWRYSDWYGRRAVPDVMNSYPQIWRWRDWIVRSLNEDQGYDQMILAMLAADELWPDDQERHAATGFIVRNWFKWNYDTWMRDQVEHTGKALLGLTFNCALCHDHKYDPVSQEDYFRFRAIFEPLELRHDRVPGQADPGPFKKYVYADSYGPIAAGMIRVFDEKLDAPTYMYRSGDQRNRFESRPAVAPGVPSILGGERFVVQPIDLPPRAYYPGLRPFVQAEERAQRRAAIAAADAALAAARRGHSESTQPTDEAAAKTLAVAERAEVAAAAKLVAVQADLAAALARIRADVARYEEVSAELSDLAKTAASLERQANLATAKANTAAASLAVAQAEAAKADDKRPAAIAAAQTKLAAAQQAEATALAELSKDDAAYSPLGPVYSAKSTGRRAALARWIASPENPLTARVAANHVWRWHFGRPLVETTANFGRNGKPPSHPELLDWLAVEFMDSGWSLKRLSRELVTSDAYCRDSEMTNDQAPMTKQIQNPKSKIQNAQAIDPDNRWYWRANLQRMEAEVVRDSVLAVAGELDQSIGGPEIDHAQGLTSRRRSLYFAHHGESKMELLELFDGASPTDCYERSTSIRPQQALALANSDLTREAARHLAGKLHATELSDESFAKTAFEQVLVRSATTDELAAAVKFLEGQQAIIGPAEPQSDPKLRSRTSMIHVLFNHHDFVTIR